jgi:hypothetical protein
MCQQLLRRQQKLVSYIRNEIYKYKKGGKLLLYMNQIFNKRFHFLNPYRSKCSIIGHCSIVKLEAING